MFCLSVILCFVVIKCLELINFFFSDEDFEAPESGSEVAEEWVLLQFNLMFKLH